MSEKTLSSVLKELNHFIDEGVNELRKELDKNYTVVFLDDYSLEKISKLQNIQLPTNKGKKEKLFNAIRKEARNFVLNTASGKKRKRHVGVVQAPTAQYVILNNVEQARRLFDRLRSVFGTNFGSLNPQSEKFLQIGHHPLSVVQFGAEKAVQNVINTLKKDNSVEAKRLIARIKEEFNAVFRAASPDSRIVYERKLRVIGKRVQKLTGKAEIFLIGTVPEPRMDNVGKSAELKLKGSFAAAFKKILETRTFAKFEAVKGSPSFEDIVGEIVENSFKGKANKQKTITTEAKRLNTRKYKGKVKKFKTPLRAKGKFTSLVSLQNLLNAKLHDSIKAHMGASSDPPIRLRYQTGRFASSVKIVNLTRTREDMIKAQYTYMHFPYDVFMPGGRLHKPERNPQRIIGASIRDLAATITNVRFSTTVI